MMRLSRIQLSLGLALVVTACLRGGPCDAAAPGDLPAAFASGSASIGGVTLSWSQRPGREPAVVLIPGTFSDGRIYSDVVAGLDAGRRTVVVELAGHGTSWPPDDNPSIERSADAAFHGDMTLTLSPDKSHWLTVERPAEVAAAIEDLLETPQEAARPPVAGLRPDPDVDPSSPLMLAGDWVPPDPATIDFAGLPKIPSRHAVIHDVRDQNGTRVNQHNYLAFHDGRFWAMWSDGPGQPDPRVLRRLGSHRDFMPGHDGIPRPGQEPNRVLAATSEDGLVWTRPFAVTGRPEPQHGWMARGFWIRDGRMLALASQFQPPGFEGPGLSLHAFELQGGHPPAWRHLGLVCDDTLNNFAPQTMRTGEWMMSRRNGRWETFTMIGGVKAIDDWKQIPIVGAVGREGFKPDEPIWWQLPDDRIAFLFRDNSRGGFLYRALSSDDGRSWSDPVRTNFPDATSKFSGCRLTDGRYVLVSNAKPGVRDPLVLSVSPDGLVFRQMGVLVGGRHVDYPHVIEHAGRLLVAFAGAKQSVEVLSIALADLDVLQPVRPR